MDASKLTTAGPYRWIRKPQYVGWFLFLLGFALNDWSLGCLAALLAVATRLHLLVLVEEERLLRIFGERYIGFCCKVPRSVGRGKLVMNLADPARRSSHKAHVAPMMPNQQPSINHHRR